MTTNNWVGLDIQEKNEIEAKYHLPFNESLFEEIEELLMEKNMKTSPEIIDGLVVCGVYEEVHDTDSYKALQDLIECSITMALDPAISERAQALVDRGMRYQRQGRTATKREWVGLTDLEIMDALTELPHFMLYFLQIARAVEGALKEKNTDAVIGFLGANT